MKALDRQDSRDVLATVLARLRTKDESSVSAVRDLVEPGLRMADVTDLRRPLSLSEPLELGDEAAILVTPLGRGMESLAILKRREHWRLETILDMCPVCVGTSTVFFMDDGLQPCGFCNACGWGHDFVEPSEDPGPVTLLRSLLPDRSLRISMPLIAGNVAKVLIHRTDDETRQRLAVLKRSSETEWVVEDVLEPCEACSGLGVTDDPCIECRYSGWKWTDTLCP